MRWGYLDSGSDFRELGECFENFDLVALLRKDCSSCESAYACADYEDAELKRRRLFD